MEIHCEYPIIDLTKTGENITRLRKAWGYSVKDLQEYCGLGSIQAVYKWVNGEGLPTTDNLLALSVAFGVPINDILVYSGCSSSRICCFRDFASLSRPTLRAA